MNHAPAWVTIVIAQRVVVDSLRAAHDAGRLEGFDRGLVIGVALGLLVGGLFAAVHWLARLESRSTKPLTLRTWE